MSLTVFGYSAIGASHILKKMPCQDYYWKRDIAESTIAVAVADGHGSSSCPFSAEGSEIAAKVFCNYMYSLYYSFEGKLQTLGSYLREEATLSIAQHIVKDWRKEILDAHDQNKRSFPLKADGITKDEFSVYHLYGTTLVGMLITPDFHFGFQIGDGDMMSVSSDTASAFLDSDQILGVETHSLCDTQPWKYAHSNIIFIEGKMPFAYLLTTDGFKNSHATNKDFLQSCIGYVEMVKENGAIAVQENLPDWLMETSSQGCGDDITMAMICDFADIAREPLPKTLEMPHVLLSPVKKIDPKTGRIENYYSLTDTETGKVTECKGKPGRNDLCPCGSGLKYKKCCGCQFPKHNVTNSQ